MTKRCLTNISEQQFVQHSTRATCTTSSYVQSYTAQPHRAPDVALHPAGHGRSSDGDCLLQTHICTAGSSESNVFVRGHLTVKAADVARLKQLQCAGEL